jgi:hypothetical protein
MTRKHFIAIANILKAFHKSEAMGWAYNIDEAFADLCYSENTQFNYERFYEACGDKK